VESHIFAIILNSSGEAVGLAQFELELILTPGNKSITKSGSFSFG